MFFFPEYQFKFSLMLYQTTTKIWNDYKLNVISLIGLKILWRKTMCCLPAFSPSFSMVSKTVLGENLNPVIFSPLLQWIDCKICLLTFRLEES